MYLQAAALALSAFGMFKSSKDSKKAAKEQALISMKDAQHRREVALYNADILRNQALRIRTEQTSRINETSGINVGRLEEVAGINTSRITEAAGTTISRIGEAYDITSGRLKTQQSETYAAGTEAENAARDETVQIIGSERAAYAAGNIVVNSGTPASLQIDTVRQGEIDALRIRKSYRRAAEQIGEQISDLKRERDYTISDINQQTGQQTGDIARTTGYQIADINRNKGYDLSDANYEADKLDQQAVLTVISGDAELAAGVNRAEAYKDAGSRAFTTGLLNTAGTIAAGFDPKWFTPSSAANTVGPLSSGYVVG
jgi:hypothetical protein